MNKLALRQSIVKSGLYKPAMWLRRHLLRREELARTRDAARFFSEWIKPDDLVFDVGANIGNAAETFLRCGAQVVSVEPLPHCVAELRARFSGQNRFTLVPKAIGAEPGSATLYISQNDFMSSFDKNWCANWERTVEVPVTTLDDLIQQFGVPRFVKIDVEGWEVQVLRGLSQTVPMMAFEYHAGDKGIAAAEECVNLLGRLGQWRFNLSGQEHWELSLSDWLDAAALIATLRQRSLDRPDSHGDIIARLV